MKTYFHLTIIVILLLSLFSCSEKQSALVENTVNYSDRSNWAYFLSSDSCGTDIFFVAPTVFAGDSAHLNMSLNDEETKTNFIGAINMEKAIYHSDVTNFYAPYYRQVGLVCYQMSYPNVNSIPQEVDQAFQTAYSDVETAFNYYLSQSSKPFILAGFSQGSQILIKLIKNRITTTELQKRHIATYAIGWGLNDSDVQTYEQLKNAQSDDDLGVVITYSSEAEFINTSLMVPEKTMSINPLNWSTDTTYVSAEFNNGACFTDYSGNITNEIPHFTGAYISSKRGTLKVPDVNPDDYPPIIPTFQKGEYHIYDYMFFYRNLQENVRHRIEKYHHLTKEI